MQIVSNSMRSLPQGCGDVLSKTISDLQRFRLCGRSALPFQGKNLAFPLSPMCASPVSSAALNEPLSLHLSSALWFGGQFPLFPPFELRILPGADRSFAPLTAPHPFSRFPAPALILEEQLFPGSSALCPLATPADPARRPLLDQEASSFLPLKDAITWFVPLPLVQI